MRITAKIGWPEVKASFDYIGQIWLTGKSGRFCRTKSTISDVVNDRMEIVMRMLFGKGWYGNEI